MNKLRRREKGNESSAVSSRVAVEIILSSLPLCLARLSAAVVYLIKGTRKTDNPPVDKSRPASTESVPRPLLSAA